MTKRQKRPRDMNKHAASTVAIATGEVTQDTSKQSHEEPTPEAQHTAAVMLGRKGGQARAKNLTLEQRTEIAKKASKARWNK